MTTAARTHDFPDWIGPMLIKELRQGLKARAFELTFIALQIVLVLVVSYHALLYARHGSRFDPSGLHAIFWMIVSTQLLVITPLRALVGLSSERKANTLELIFMTGLTSWRIAFGKWASLLFQSLLFVLAVLPFALLRYFFGGVNITEDLTAMGLTVLASALLTAATLAISGMPLFVRIVAIGLLLLASVGFLPGLMFAFFFRSAGASMGMSFSFDGYWWLIIFNAALLVCACLESAASSIAPLAENHAMRQRLFALAAIIPVPFLMAFDYPEYLPVVQGTIFGVLALLVAWMHLAVQPPLLRVHLEPFSRRTAFGLLPGSLLQPGWPSAVLFLLLAEGIVVGLPHLSGLPAKGDFLEYSAVFLMAGAALLTPVLLSVLLRRKSRWALVEHTIFHILCGAIMIFAQVMERRSGSHFGDTALPAILPSFGFWAMLDNGLTSDNVNKWVIAGALMLLVQAVILTAIATPYWRSLMAFHRSIRAARTEPPLAAEVAA